VSIRDHDHRFADPTLSVAEQGYEVAPVRLGRNVWLGCNVTVLKGVSLGDSCVVGANAVVTTSFPAGSVLAGVPARVLKRLPIEESHVSTD
jgi:acetyltransferase-like isoleucine patch superfamily enzyme